MKIWIACIAVVLAMAANEYTKWRQWNGTMNIYNETQAKLLEFMAQGDRFTLEDGLTLCHELRAIEADLGRPQIDCLGIVKEAQEDSEAGLQVGNPE